MNEEDDNRVAFNGLSDAAKNACIWLSCSEEADRLTVAEARQKLSDLFGIEVADELRRFFSPDKN